MARPHDCTAPHLLDGKPNSPRIRDYKMHSGVPVPLSLNQSTHRNLLFSTLVIHLEMVQANKRSVLSKFDYELRLSKLAALRPAPLRERSLIDRLPTYLAYRPHPEIQREVPQSHSRPAEYTSGHWDQILWACLPSPPNSPPAPAKLAKASRGLKAALRGGVQSHAPASKQSRKLSLQSVGQDRRKRSHVGSLQKSRPGR